MLKFLDKSKFHIYSSVCARCISSRGKSNFEYCLELVRKCDYENYLSTLLLPSVCQPAVFAIRAFNIELAQIRDLVSEPKLGLMRIQFWKDSLDKIYEGTSPHSPVAQELSRAVHPLRLTKRWFQRIIDSRREQIASDAPFDSLAQVEQIADSSHSSVNFLILEVLGVRNVHADHTASHVGKAQGLTTLVRAVPYHARKNNVYLPTDLMIKHHISQQDVIRGCREQKMKDLIYDVASEAHKHLTKAESFRKDLPPAAIVAFLPAVATRAFLKAVQRVNFDIFDPRLEMRNNWLPLTLWLYKIRKSY